MGHAISDVGAVIGALFTIEESRAPLRSIPPHLKETDCSA